MGNYKIILSSRQRMREKERGIYGWQFILLIHRCSLTKPYWGQELLGRDQTSWIIHQLYLPQLINPLLIPPSPTKASDSVTLFLSKPFRCFFPPLTFAWNPPSPLHRAFQVQPFSSNAHNIADFIKNYTCSVTQQGHASYRYFSSWWNICYDSVSSSLRVLLTGQTAFCLVLL